MTFDYGRDVMAHAHKLANFDPQLAANYMEQAGCGDLIKKMSSIPIDIVPDVTKTKDIMANAGRAIEKAKVSKNNYMMIGCIVAAGVMVTGGYYLYRRRKKSK